MKSDPDVRMIASDAPVLFCKACEIFIQEITCRAFLVADAHKRRTISKADIAKALAKSDQFDFLIDVVPRDEAERAKTHKINHNGLDEAHERQAAAEAAAMVSGMQSAGGSMHPHGHVSPTSQQHPMYQQQQAHMAMPHHMQPPPQPGPSVHPGAPMHQQHHSRGSHPHSGLPQQGSQSGQPAPLNLSMPSHHNGRGHSQSQPPPLIPNNMRSPTTATHPHNNNPHAHQQPHANSRRPSVTRMSLSPTIPLSSSRMDPPSTLDINGR